MPTAAEHAARMSVPTRILPMMSFTTVCPLPWGSRPQRATFAPTSTQQEACPTRVRGLRRKPPGLNAPTWPHRPERAAAVLAPGSDKPPRSVASGHYGAGQTFAARDTAVAVATTLARFGGSRLHLHL